MGWSFRKTFTLGPLHLNLSGKGLGWSIGLGPFRWGKTPDGETRKTLSIPGTGIRYQKTKKD